MKGVIKMFSSLHETTSQSGGMLTTVIYVVLIAVMVVVLFVLPSRSRKKQEKEFANMCDSLAVGDEVTTIGGIIGKVVSINGETFVLETTKAKTQIRFLKGAIRSVDVKAADIAAQVIEAKANEEKAGEEEKK